MREAAAVRQGRDEPMAVALQDGEPAGLEPGAEVSAETSVVLEVRTVVDEAAVVRQGVVVPSVEPGLRQE